MKRVTVFTGHRDVENGHETLIREAGKAAARESDLVVLGGAAGADTIFLEAIWEAVKAESLPCDITVIVPGRLGSQPTESIAAIEKIRSEWFASKIGIVVVEMDLPWTKWAPLKRNLAMLDRAMGPDIAGNLVAYWDGKEEGGSWHTVKNALERKLSLTNCYPVKK